MIGQKIGFIGAGNMARSLIGGLIKNGIPAAFICVSDINADALDQLQQDFGINTTQDNAEIISFSDVVIFAIKPQVMQQVIKPLGPIVNSQQPLLISIAAGIRESDISAWLNCQAAVVRCMPNTPALVGAGATGLFANSHVNDDQKLVATAIMDAVGITTWLAEERQQDAITALSGSGPAYFFMVIEAMENAAVGLGLSTEQARKMAIETAYGAAKMARKSDVEPAKLRANVTSEGGTTAAALKVFETEKLTKTFAKAMQSAYDRSIELGELMGEDK